MNEDVAAAVRSLESSRTALAVALARPQAGRRKAADSAGAARGVLDAVWSSFAEASGERWRRGNMRASLELARPVVEDAVRQRPWTAVAVAGLCGAVAVWVVSTRRRLLFSAAWSWWRTAGTAILVSTAFKLYEQHVAATNRPASAPADRGGTDPAAEG
ncbi:MAG: hypothetical protein JSS42_03715 [Proteobacteria bacterium]|uniref:hypothetical protein n=1 Tax=Rudaea sp. TaxID=2136325 RepID=UPI0032208BAB|nr:hypothetical protein [Pseudomonadota bacterium]